MDLDVIFAAVVGVLAALAVIGALAFMIVAEWYAIRRTIERHRHPASDGFWRDRGALVPTIPAERELVRDGARRVLAGHSLRGIVLDWKGRGPHGQRQP